MDVGDIREAGDDVAGMSTVRPDLDERYGRRPPAGPRRRRVLLALLVAFLLIGGGWAVWAGFVVTRASLSWQDAGVDAADPAAVRVSFVVRASAGAQVVCTARATDAAGAVVGWLDVPVDVPASGTATVTATVPTSEPATGGAVGTCARR